MPVYESACQNRECRNGGYMRERYEPHFTTTDPACEACGGPTVRFASSFAVVFTGPITAKYNSPTAERSDLEGHWAWRKRSSKSGNPEPVFIDTFEKQKAFCKEEGLVNPKDCPNMDASTDGRLSSNAGVGMPGAWV